MADLTTVNSEPILVFSARAREVLSPHIDALGQWFELRCDEAPYFLFNLTRVVDVLDQQRCVFSYYSDGGIMHIKEFAFHPELVKDELLFKVPQRRGSFNLATDRFKGLVEQHGLTGFRFDKVWSDELQIVVPAPIPEIPPAPRTPVIGPLEPAAVVLLGRWQAAGMQLLGQSEGTSAEAIVHAIDEYIDRWQDEETGQPIDPATVDALAALWGGQMVRRFDWRWCQLDKHRAVSAPDGSLMMLPWAYVHACFDQVDLDCAIALAVNMLAAGRIPPQQPGGYVDVMQRVAHIVPKR